MRAEIVAVGSELLTPSRLDTNSLFVTRQLNTLGIVVRRKSIVGDQAAEIREAFLNSLRKSEIVILMGGLGSTNDDITREVVSEALGRRLSLDPEILDRLTRRYQKMSLKMTENNRRQAMVTEGAVVMRNPNGTAPGLFLKEGKTLVFLLPGPPGELQAMMINEVMTLIQKHKRTSRQEYRQLKVASEVESKVDSLVESVYKSFPKIETTIVASPGVIELFFFWRGENDLHLADRELNELVERVRSKLGKSIFTDKDESLEEVVGRSLLAQRKTLATAESCTGGAISKMLTDVPGSSDYYLGGVVCYSNDSKTHLVGVNETTLERFGAVSKPVAHQMALGIRKRVDSDYALSATGIAGPDGGTPEKPVGLVFLGLSTPDGTEVRELRLGAGREVIRVRSARLALDWLRRKLEGRSD